MNENLQCEELPSLNNEGNTVNKGFYSDRLMTINTQKIDSENIFNKNSYKSDNLLFRPNTDIKECIRYKNCNTINNAADVELQSNNQNDFNNINSEMSIKVPFIEDDYNENKSFDLDYLNTEKIAQNNMYDFLAHENYSRDLNNNNNVNLYTNNNDFSVNTNKLKQANIGNENRFKLAEKEKNDDSIIGCPNLVFQEMQNEKFFNNIFLRLQNSNKIKNYSDKQLQGSKSTKNNDNISSKDIFGYTRFQTNTNDTSLGERTKNLSKNNINNKNNSNINNSNEDRNIREFLESTDGLICSRCKKVVPDSFCEQCKAYFCSKCKLNLHMRREFQKHTISSISKNILKSKEESKQQKNEDYKDFYMSQDKKAQLDEINTHYINHKKVLLSDNLELKDKLENIHKNFVNLLGNVQYDLRSIQQEGLHDLKKFEDVVEIKIQECSKYYETIINEFQIKMSNMIEENKTLRNDNRILVQGIKDLEEKFKTYKVNLEKEKINKKGEVSRINRVYETKIQNLIDQFDLERDEWKKLKFEMESNYSAEMDKLNLHLEEAKIQIDDLRLLNNTYIHSRELMKIREESKEIFEENSELKLGIEMFKEENFKLFNKANELISENTILQQNVDNLGLEIVFYKEKIIELESKIPKKKQLTQGKTRQFKSKSKSKDLNNS